MNSKSLKQKLIRFFKGKQGGAVPTAIKVLTAVVCGAVIMMGLYGVVTGVVLPASSDKVTSMFSYEAEGGAGGSGGDGGYGGGTGDPTPVYEMLEGDGQTVNTNAFAPLTFRSSASIEKFQAVKVDGAVVDASNYTVTEGSTIVTFNADYTKNLANGSHTIELVSSDGCANAGFSVNTTNVIPEGGTYIIASTGETLTEGNNFPDISKHGDAYLYKDYRYMNNGDGTWSVLIHENVGKNKDSYGDILESINNNLIGSLNGTFSYCTNLTKSPIIPSGVTDLYGAFEGCSNLIQAPVIPLNVTIMYNTFMSCTSLEAAPIIPSNVTDMHGTFGSCSNLIQAPVIPSSVTDLTGTFWGATALSGTVEINTNTTDYYACLRETNISSVIGTTPYSNEILATK